MSEKKKAIEKYNDIVKRNLQNPKNYFDPDQAYECEVEVYDDFFKSNRVDRLFKIRLSTDGLCSINKIKAFSDSPKELKNYQLIREGMFGCLVWPTYAQSINQMRGLKSIFDDRLDLTLIDIQTFYEIINKHNKITVELIEEIRRRCELAKAYLNMLTFTWLYSFGDFNNFIKKRNLEAFVDNTVDGFVAKIWTGGKKFDKSYFVELMARVKKYRTQNGV